DDGIVHVRGQRDADRGVLQRLDQLVLHVLLAIPAGDAVIDTHDVGEVTGLHGAHVGTVACKVLEVVAGPVVDLPGLRPGLRPGDRVVARRQVFATAHRAVDDVVWRQ